MHIYLYGGDGFNSKGSLEETGLDPICLGRELGDEKGLHFSLPLATLKLLKYGDFVQLHSEERNNIRLVIETDKKLKSIEEKQILNQDGCRSKGVYNRG